MSSTKSISKGIHTSKSSEEKKYSKTSLRESTSPVDCNAEKKSYEAEVSAAKSLDLKATILKDTELCDNIRETITGDKKSVGKKPSAPSLLVNLVKLRNVNRTLQLRQKVSRDSVFEARQSAESKHLQLENLLYEVGHLEKQISACRSYRSRADDIPLVSVEEFYSNAPAKIARPEETQQDDHELFKARLAWELEQRKQLAQKLKEVEDDVDQITLHIESKKALLDALRPRLRTVIDASVGLDEILIHKQEGKGGMAPISCPSKRAQLEMSMKLPQKLHALFVKLHALSEVRGGTDIQSVEIKSTSEKVLATGGNISSKAHELSVGITIVTDLATLDVAISCFPGLDDLLIAESKLNRQSSEMASAKASPLLNCAQLLLSNLIQAHAKKSLSLPPAIRRKLPQKLTSQAKEILNLAYPWLHIFSGALPVVTECSEQEEFLNSAFTADKLVAYLIDRMSARLSLFDAVSDLDSCSLPLAFVDESFQLPASLASNIRVVECNFISQLDGSKSTAHAAAANSGEIGSNTKFRTELQEKGFYYRIKLDRNKYLLVVDVIIPANYPQQWPIFFCSSPGRLHSDMLNMLTEMQSDINVEIGRKLLLAIAAKGVANPSSIMNKLFATQICQLAVCWDACYEVLTNPAIHGKPQRRGRDRCIAWCYDSRKGYSFAEDEPLAVYGAVADLDLTSKLQWDNDESDSDSSNDSGDEAAESREERLTGERPKETTVIEKMDEDSPMS